LHGNCGTGEVFSRLLPHLPPAQYILPDLPWHSPHERWAPFMDSPDVAAGYCLHIMDILGIHRFDMAGHSLGGMIGLTLALEHPDRIASLALLDSFVTLRERPRELCHMTAFDPSNQDHESAIRRQMSNPMVKWHTTFDVAPRVRAVRCPVLELQGESMPGTDAIYETWLRQHRAGYPPTWAIRRIMGGAHFFLVEQPEHTAKALREFWEGNPESTYHSSLITYHLSLK